ncbi:MAG: proprotein convertase P-domain-containing protein, partial [Planctomycetes bacterium]|nr:proprotein convertase P-domain-containing protein [Planctomycetota bacterium]
MQQDLEFNTRKTPSRGWRSVSTGEQPSVGRGAAGFENSGFGFGDFTHWTVENTFNGDGAPGAVGMYDIDGPGPLGASCAAKFSVGLAAGGPGQPPRGVILTQVLTLLGGVQYTFEYDWSTFLKPGSLPNAGGGTFFVLVDGVEIASHSSGDLGYGGVTAKYGHLSGVFTPPSNGDYEVGAKIGRSFFPSASLLQYVDNFSPSEGPPGGDVCPTFGACCFADGGCTSEEGEAACLTSGGDYYYGDDTTCDPNPCLQPQGNDCTQPLVVTLPAELPYTDVNTTCGRGDSYDDTCLGNWDGGEDIIYELVVTQDICVHVAAGTGGSLGSWFGFAVDDTCPPSAADCVAMATTSFDNLEINDLLLAPGTYYLMVDTWPPPDCLDSFTLTITACPSGACCTDAPNCFDASEEECLLAGGTYVGDGTACGGDCDSDGVTDACAIAGGARDCQPNNIPDQCDIDTGPSADLDGNGIPDECQFDCNANGIPDGCDVSCGPAYCSTNYPSDCGLSNDCQPDGLPDECELGYADSGPIYLIDDGSGEGAVGLIPGGDVAWLNHFTVQPGAETIIAVHMTWGDMRTGVPTTVYLWNDPNGDGDPTDATVLASAQTVSANPFQPIFTVVDIPDTFVGVAGTSFFVGALITHLAFEFPAYRDNDSPQGESWLAGDQNHPLDPNDLGDAEFPVSPVGQVTTDGNWLIRAEGVGGAGGADCNSNGVPDDCDLAATTSDDCDGTGVPDECEVAQQDCNSNGIIDSCDIAAATSTDLNNNGLPDDCEDCNTNGIPDDLDLLPSGGSPVDYQIDVDPDAPISNTLPPTVSIFNVTSSGIIADLDVQVDITHTWLSDLTIEIEHNGTTVLLSNQRGADGDDFEGTIFDDEADTPIGNGTAPFAGRYIPDEMLAAFDNTDMAGDWTLTVTDAWASDDGTLDAWALHFVSGAAPPFSEDCNANGLPDECDLVGGTSEDCNSNGLLDDCELAQGTSEDCNGNAVPDECDITSGTSDDCQPDGIPDECQLGGGSGRGATLYQHDDGTHENTLGLTNGGFVIWLNHFTVEAGAGTITAISLAWGDMFADGAAATVFLWADPNGDGDPTDAVVLASAGTTVANNDTDIFTNVDIPDTLVGPAGTSFFVGAKIGHFAGEHPASYDTDPPLPSPSWIAGEAISLAP